VLYDDNTMNLSEHDVLANNLGPSVASQIVFQFKSPVVSWASQSITVSLDYPVFGFERCECAVISAPYKSADIGDTVQF